MGLTTTYSGSHLVGGICLGLLLGTCTSLWLEHRKSKLSVRALSASAKAKQVEKETAKEEETPPPAAKTDPEIEGEEHNDDKETNYKVVCAIRIQMKKCFSQQELLDLYQKAIDAGILSEYIEDQGRTQIEPGSLTVVAVGPALASLVDTVAGKLKNL
ncbi:hypothetical protein HDU67_000737 [Dinochytrium kinnereticum]|nr:hypothetical protein HDU67_000737 [Dinochytrium kinnereticum]